MEPTPFNFVVDTGNFKLGQSSREYIDKRMAKMEQWTRKFPSRECHLSLQVSDRDNMHRFVISLRLPQVTLVGHAEEPHLRNGFDRALKRLMRQLNEFKHVMRREHLHRSARDNRIEPSPVDETELNRNAVDRNLAGFKAALGEHIDGLREMVGAELIELRWRYPEAELRDQEVVERTLQRAIDRFADKPAGVGRRHWLYQMALEVIDEAVPRQGIAEDAGRPGGSLGETGSWRVVVEDDDDVDERAAAAEAASMLGTEQMRQIVEEKLAVLPRDWRRAFRMHYVDGLDLAEIGDLLDLQEDQVRFRLRGAAEFLRDHLDELRGSV